MPVGGGNYGYCRVENVPVFLCTGSPRRGQGAAPPSSPETKMRNVALAAGDSVIFSSRVNSRATKKLILEIKNQLIDREDRCDRG